MLEFAFGRAQLLLGVLKSLLRLLQLAVLLDQTVLQEVLSQSDLLHSSREIAHSSGELSRLPRNGIFEFVHLLLAGLQQSLVVLVKLLALLKQTVSFGDQLEHLLPLLLQLPFQLHDRLLHLRLAVGGLLDLGKPVLVLVQLLFGFIFRFLQDDLLFGHFDDALLVLHYHHIGGILLLQHFLFQRAALLLQRGHFALQGAVLELEDLQLTLQVHAAAHRAHFEVQPDTSEFVLALCQFRLEILRLQLVLFALGLQVLALLLQEADALQSTVQLLLHLLELGDQLVLLRLERSDALLHRLALLLQPSVAFAQLAHLLVVAGQRGVQHLVVLAHRLEANGQLGDLVLVAVDSLQVLFDLRSQLILLLFGLLTELLELVDLLLQVAGQFGDLLLQVRSGRDLEQSGAALPLLRAGRLVLAAVQIRLAFGHHLTEDLLLVTVLLAETLDLDQELVDLLLGRLVVAVLVLVLQLLVLLAQLAYGGQQLLIVLVDLLDVSEGDQV